MKLRLLFLLIVLSFCYTTVSLHAQDSVALSKLKSYSQHILKFSKEYPQEKAYLHFDNTSYYLGETIWFKAYVVRAEYNSLTQLSKTLYVELVTPEGNVLDTRKLKIDNGQCHGDFLLRDSLIAGFYEVRAYTRYMLNQDKEYIFSRVFAIYDKPKNAGDFSIQTMWQRPFSLRVPTVRKEYNQKEELSVSFFPECGNLIAGIESKVAFKAMDKAGQNAIISGNVYDQAGKSVAEISTIYQGMGVFSYTPTAGKYKAKVQYNDKEYSFDLPNAQPRGYAMSIDNVGENQIDIILRKNPATKNESLGLTITSRGVLYGFKQVTWQNDSLAAFSIPQRLLPTGVTQITLFNVEGQILSERLVFINHHSQLKMDVVQNKGAYNAYEKVNLDFQLNDMKNQPVETTFSLAVRDAGTSSFNPYRDNILTNLLLSSELRGYIENPGYYFEKDTPARKAALDLLLLTQGWTRYVWQQMAGVTPFTVKHPIEKSLVIEGTVLSLLQKKPKANVDVFMTLICDSTSQRGSCVTDEEGRFNMELADFNGKGRLTIQTNEKGKKKEHIVKLDRVFSPESKIYAYQEKLSPENILIQKDTIAIKQDTTIIDQQEKQPEQKVKTQLDKKAQRLDEVVVKARKITRREAESLRNASVVYDVEKSTDELIDKGEDEPANILDFIRKSNQFFTFSTSTSEGWITGRYKGKNVIFCLNNNSLVDSIDKNKTIYNSYEKLANLSTNEIETATVCELEGVSLFYLPPGRRDILCGFSGSEVVIFLYTYKDLHSRNNVYGIRQTNLQGYSAVKEFFNPRYDYTPLPNEKDYRRTLYWNPDVKTDANGKASVIFYNNSSCKSFNISAETVTENGVIGVINK